jgi:hypothetical protein
MNSAPTATSSLLTARRSSPPCHEPAWRCSLPDTGTPTPTPQCRRELPCCSSPGRIHLLYVGLDSLHRNHHLLSAGRGASRSTQSHLRQPASTPAPPPHGRPSLLSANPEAEQRWLEHLSPAPSPLCLSFPIFMLKPSTHRMHDPGSNVPHIRPKSAHI